MWIGVKRQLVVVITHRGGRKATIERQILNTARQISETVRDRTHVHINFFLRMTDTMTSKNIDFATWDTLYSFCCRQSFYVEHEQRDLCKKRRTPNNTWIILLPHHVFYHIALYRFHFWISLAAYIVPVLMAAVYYSYIYIYITMLNNSCKF
jgi:hypothetical protein